MRPSEVQRARGGRHIAILLFHSIAEDGGEYSIDPATFRRFVEFISGEYEVVPLGDIAPAFQRPPDRRPLVIFTFDDAFEDFYENAFPVLQKSSVPSALFVPTGFIGRTNAWDSPTTNLVAKKVMDTQRILELSQTGAVEIGSHSVDHLSMAQLCDNDMYRQARDSKERLDELLPWPVRLFSYPYGMKEDHSDKTMDILRRSGYETAVTSNWGTFQRLEDLLRLKRIELTSRDSLANVRRKIEGFYDWYWAKEEVAFLARATISFFQRTIGS